jgi:hypothetical protein
MVFKYHQLVYKENTKFAAAKDRTPDQQPTPAQSLLFSAGWTRRRKIRENRILFSGSKCSFCVSINSHFVQDKKMTSTFKFQYPHQIIHVLSLHDTQIISITPKLFTIILISLRPFLWLVP